MRTGPALSYILMVFWLAFYSKTATMYCKSSPVSAFDFNWASASWQSEQRHQFSRQLSIQCLSHLILPRLLDSHFVGLVLHQKLVDLHVLSEIQHDVSAWCPRKLSNVVIARNHAEPTLEPCPSASVCLPCTSEPTKSRSFKRLTQHPCEEKLMHTDAIRF